MNDIDKRVEKSDGYQIVIDNLNRCFGENNYAISHYQYDGESNDETNNDFRIVVDFEKLKGVTFIVGSSGYTRIQRVGGTGQLSITLPSERQIGTELTVILGTKEFQFAVFVNRKEEVKYYFDLLTDYYNNL